MDFEPVMLKVYVQHDAKPIIKQPLIAETVSGGFDGVMGLLKYEEKDGLCILQCFKGLPVNVYLKKKEGGQMRLHSVGMGLEYLLKGFVNCAKL